MKIYDEENKTESYVVHLEKDQISPRTPVNIDMPMVNSHEADLVVRTNENVEISCNKNLHMYQLLWLNQWHFYLHRR